MGYSPFNLTTLQLPAPSSNMTKAEYKDAYGIDLDDINIKAFKLVLFGGEKYAIDQIKEVEDGFEIYFNGRIMSITDVVQVSDEVYNVANSKPIYIHPVTIQRGDIYRLGLFIFNNSPEPIDTWAKLKTALVGVATAIGGTARFPITGGIYDSANTRLLVAQVLDVETSGDIYAYGIGPNGETSSTYVNITGIDASFVYDGVNKIN